jgi:LmbE family N-acetylglucosaminyl deacetylase
MTFGKAKCKASPKNLRQNRPKPHPCKVLSSIPIKARRRWSASWRFWLGISVGVMALALPAVLFGWHSPQEKDDAAPSTSVNQPPQFYPLPCMGVPPELPQDQGMPGLRLMLRRLRTTARLMQTVAHPDDEDGGMLTLESRGHGDSVLLMTLNRGEGGQNKIGSNLFDVLGVVRTLELLAADQYYGVQERFSRVADFGYSKSAEETFSKWGGHDIALGDMVRVIRTFQPDVLVARFSGTERDGHGHHQASSILTQEAFRAAADPKRFPEQITEGLQPWQAQKLYIGNVCSFGAQSCADDKWTVKLNSGKTDPDLDGSYIQFAMKGLRHQLSQGAANWSVEPGDRFTFYKLVDSVEPPKLDKDGHEKDFFDGIDTTLPGLVSRLGSEDAKVPQLRQELTDAARKIAEASEDVNKDDTAAVSPLTSALSMIRKIEGEVGGSSLSTAAKADLSTRLGEKQEQAEAALDLALNVTLEAALVSRVDARGHAAKELPKESDELAAVSPGQEFLVAVDLHNGSKRALTIDGLKVEVPEGWATISDKTRREIIKPGSSEQVVFRLRVPKDAKYTRPYWHRDDPETESINHIDDPQYLTLPFPPPPLRARVTYSLADAASPIKIGIEQPVVAEFLDEADRETARPLSVVPAFSVALEPGTQTISTHNGATSTVTVGVTSNLSRDVQGTLQLELPAGWRSDPTQLSVHFTHRGEKQDFEFKIFPAGLQQGRATIRAILQVEGEKFAEGYTLVTREDLGSFYYYQPAIQRVSIVDVTAPHDLKIGYIMGAGDDIPTVLRQIGMNVTLIPPEKLATENLSQYATIVLGIRAYDTQKDVVANNQKLLDFVSAGGTLLVQYNTGVADFNNGHFTPYPSELSRARVSVEEAPVEILAPDNEVFHYPNRITPRDFDDWVQERGLYFMDKWDDHFQPLLSCHDPGEEPQKGGLLLAHYGKGIYIYDGYAFFRQLPAGVPGAVRLYVNLLNAGHEQH